MSTEHNLSNTELNESDIAELVYLLTKRCGAKTTRRVESGLRYGLDQLPHWAQPRLYNDGSGWAYCAGQCYPSEIATIRGYFN